ncbi:hypothetical protein AB0H30_23810 [Streptomyces pseudogriseolus]|uniref:hypothetical protein n=1 Tax=Streptomyces pseudogriseolus TaxID=36817 RepID=UPI003498790C
MHFTRETADGGAIDNLKAILEDRVTEARNAFGMATALAKRYTAIADSQRTVCFTETPLEHAWMMCEQIPGRTMRFDGYGLASTRTFARRRGANPVWYLDITPGHDWLTTPVNNMVDQVKEIAKDSSKGGADAAAAADVLRLTPSIEQMGLRDLVVVFAPQKDHDELEDHLAELIQRGRRPHLVDARWGLERMIAALTDVDEPGPFPS